VIDGDLYVANLGDCRAVISRHGAAAALTSDHTPARDDERSRIESSVIKLAPRNTQKKSNQIINQSPN
jgi:serine/threonine protein phosphatase PrpC